MKLQNGVGVLSVRDEGGLVLFFSGTLIALLLGTFLAIRPGPITTGQSNSTESERTTVSFRTYYPNIHRLSSIEPSAKPYLDIVQKAVQKHASIYELDPLLVLALIKKESAFNVRVVSYAGAAGPMQFMPGTGLEMGLDPVYAPDILERADRLKNRAGALYTRAVRHMKAEQYSALPGLIDRWKKVNRQKRRMYKRYRRKLKGKIRNKSTQELAEIDQRFLRKKAVMSGVKYLATLFKERDGDIRESLAAYNAGPGSVRRYEGIPPYDQTVRYQNKIVNTYQRYRRHLDPSLRSRRIEPTLSLAE